jgi:hypothetical protein
MLYYIIMNKKIILLLLVLVLFCLVMKRQNNENFDINTFDVKKNTQNRVAGIPVYYGTRDINSLKDMIGNSNFDNLMNKSCSYTIKDTSDQDSAFGEYEGVVTHNANTNLQADLLAGQEAGMIMKYIDDKNKLPKSSTEINFLSKDGTRTLDANNTEDLEKIEKIRSNEYNLYKLLFRPQYIPPQCRDHKAKAGTVPNVDGTYDPKDLEPISTYDVNNDAVDVNSLNLYDSAGRLRPNQLVSKDSENRVNYFGSINGNSEALPRNYIEAVEFFNNAEFQVALAVKEDYSNFAIGIDTDLKEAANIAILRCMYHIKSINDSGSTIDTTDMLEADKKHLLATHPRLGSGIDALNNGTTMDQTQLENAFIQAKDTSNEISEKLNNKVLANGEISIWYGNLLDKDDKGVMKWDKLRNESLNGSQSLKVYFARLAYNEHTDEKKVIDGGLGNRTELFMINNERVGLYHLFDFDETTDNSCKNTLDNITSKCLEVNPNSDCFEAVILGLNPNTNECKTYHEKIVINDKYKMGPGMNNSGVDEDVYLQLVANARQKSIDNLLKQCIDENTNEETKRAHCVVKYIDFDNDNNSEYYGEANEFQNSLGYDN